LAKTERSRGHTIPWPRQKGQEDTTKIYQTLHSKLKIEQQEPTLKSWMNSNATEMLTVPLVTPVIKLSNMSVTVVFQNKPSRKRNKIYTVFRSLVRFRKFYYCKV
jgi:hypothetical protein